MAYKMAVGSSDGVNVDLKFGEVDTFLIFEAEGLEYKLLERRKVTSSTSRCATASGNTELNLGSCKSSGCGGKQNGCSGPAEIIHKVEKIQDCRCIVCKKIGFQAQRQLEKKAISVFDIEGSIGGILEKIIAYYGKIDKK